MGRKAGIVSSQTDNTRADRQYDAGAKLPTSEHDQVQCGASELSQQQAAISQDQTTAIVAYKQKQNQIRSNTSTIALMTLHNIALDNLVSQQLK